MGPAPARARVHACDRARPGAPKPGNACQVDARVCRANVRKPPGRWPRCFCGRGRACAWARARMLARECARVRAHAPACAATNAISWLQMRFCVCKRLVRQLEGAECFCSVRRSQGKTPSVNAIVRYCLSAPLLLSPAIAQLVEHLTVDRCSNQMVPGSIPGGRNCQHQCAMMLDRQPAGKRSKRKRGWLGRTDGGRGNERRACTSWFLCRFRARRPVTLRGAREMVHTRPPCGINCVLLFAVTDCCARRLRGLMDKAPPSGFVFLS